MGISVLQPSFSSGELSPSLQVRVDLARWQTGLKLCKNFFVLPYGGVRNRPGSVYIDSTKGDKLARLIRFKFSNRDAYALEFTNLLMRVYRAGALVLNTAGPNIGQPFELVTPFTEAELAELTFVQSADVMTFAHPSHPPQELKRFAADNWTISAVPFLPSIAAPASAAAAYVGGGTTGSTTPWHYQVTAVLDDGSTIEESLPVTSNNVTVFLSAPIVSVSWPAVTGATYYLVYKDASGSGVYGFAARVASTSLVDNNIIPTKTDTPPNNENPFDGVGAYPCAVGYYQQRLVFGGTDLRPQTNWFSKVGAFHNYGYSTPTKDDDAITFTQSSLEVERIQHYLPLRELLVLTTGAEWVFSGDASGITPKNLQANAQSYNGCGNVPPIVLNNVAIYVQARGSQVGTLSYSLEDDGFAGEDLTVLSSHLFRDYSIIEWGYQKVPDTIVWCVRSDGALLGLTYLRKQDVVGWHQHETDGFYESVCTLPEGREDAVYVVVRRIINGVTRRYVERFASRRIPLKKDETLDVAQCFFVDCGLSYQGWNTTVKTRTLSGGTTWKYPEELTCTDSSGAGFVPTDPGNFVNFIYLDENGLEKILMTRITTYVSAGVVKVTPEEPVPVSLRNVATTRWGRGVDVLEGLNHLEGKTVSILADGFVVAPQVVTAGKIEIDIPSVVIHVGLGYVSDLQTLAINVQGNETMFDKNKTIPSVTLMVEESRGIFAGQSFDKLDELKMREYEGYDDPIALLTGPAKVSFDANWEGLGSICVRQTDPLPLSILGAIPELVPGGKN